MRDHISATHKGMPNNSNGPQGSTSAITFRSVEMVKWCLKTFKEKTKSYEFDLSIPTVTPSNYMSNENIEIIREWASVKGYS
jgi:hypothetical protein